MYLETDEYLSKYRRNFKDDKEAYEHLKKCFPSLTFLPVKGSYLSAELCLFAYLFYCYSIGELANAFGIFFASASVRTRIAELKSKGTGAISTLSFSRYDMGARKAYNITKSGFSFYLSNLPDAVKSNNGKVMIRRSGGLVPAHDYGVGLSLLSFMQTGIPFYYEKEENYTFKGSFKEKGSVCVDCTVYTYRDDGYKLYIEQDMGNETTLTLVNKIATYKHLGMTGQNSTLVISSHAVTDYSSCKAFNSKVLEKIYGDMVENDESDVYEYYLGFQDELNEEELLCLASLLVRTGVCVAYKDKESMRNGTALLPEQISVTSILRRNMHVQYKMKVEISAVPCKDFTLQELRRYIDDLAAGINPYRQRIYNMGQDQVAKQKFRNMASMLCRHIDRGAYERDEVMCALNGYSCYVVPSVLLCNSVPYFIPEDADFIKAHRKCLIPYYPGIDKAPYQTLSKAYHFEKHASVVLRNAFVLSDGKVVVLEHVGKDVCGFLRAYYLRLLSGIYPELNLHVVCLCDNEEDMLYFCKVARYEVKYSRFPETDGFYMSFLMEKDIYDEDCLLEGITDLENPVPVYLRTAKQSEEFNRFLKERTAAGDIH